MRWTYLKNPRQYSLFFENDYGYALFSTIGKAGVGIGGAYGEGKVFQGSEVTGTSSIVKLSIGWQLGGQKFNFTPAGEKK